MSLTLTFDQPGSGLPAGVTDRSRTDIVNTGPAGTRAWTITITVGSIPASSTVDIALLDRPPSANAALTQLSATSWSLAFDKAVYGPFRVRARARSGGLVVDQCTRRLTIRSSLHLLEYPALSEQQDPNAVVIAGADSIALTEANEAGTNNPLTRFYRQLVAKFEAGLLSSFATRNGIVLPLRADYAGLYDSNPFLRRPNAPDAFNDEFDSGDPAFENRPGPYDVYNYSTAQTMTRLGDIRLGATNIALTATQYRSTQRGSQVMAQFPLNTTVMIMKPVTGSGLYMSRMGFDVADSAAVSMMLRVTGFTGRPYQTAAHNSGAGAGWCNFGPDAPFAALRILGRNLNAVQNYDAHDTAYGRDWSADIYGINHDDTLASAARFAACWNSHNLNQIYTGTVQANTGFPALFAGWFLNTGSRDQTKPGSVFMFDYLRKLPLYDPFTS